MSNRDTVVTSDCTTRLFPSDQIVCEHAEGYGPSLGVHVPNRVFSNGLPRHAMRPKVMKRSLFLAFIEPMIYNWMGGS
jgi:hypothetical protein